MLDIKKISCLCIQIKISTTWNWKMILHTKLIVACWTPDTISLAVTLPVRTLFLAKCPIASWIFLMLAMRLFFVSLKTLIPRSTSTSVSKTFPSFDPLTRLETLTGGFAFANWRLIHRVKTLSCLSNWLSFIKMYSVFIVDCVWERYWRSSKEFIPKKWSFSELRVSQRVVWLGKIVWRLLIISSTCQISVHRRFCDRELRWNPLLHFR